MPTLASSPKSIMLDRCPKCGGLFSLIGYRHLCRETPITATKPVTLPVTVTNPTILVTPVTPTVTCSRCVFLESEVKRLKQELAKAGKKQAGMSGAERTRRYRERRRASVDKAIGP